MDSTGAAIQAYGSTLASGTASDYAYAGAMLQGIGDMFKVGSSTGEAFGYGAGAGAIVSAMAEDAGRMGSWILAIVSVAGAGEAAFAKQPVQQGIYEFADAASPGRTYVGQSGNLPARLSQHTTSGRLAEGTKVRTSAVNGGKTAREVAEQKRINQLGGTREKPGSRTSNIRNPIGPKRSGCMLNEPGCIPDANK
jgi:hypothetical protein